mmetsp:Transcript_6846/g.22419  ORF Transcript_6846/g.22419 Transcript_6846/m.22419 type:complete len:410 (+) Transcript_6846:84-1313(+)
MRTLPLLLIAPLLYRPSAARCRLIAANDDEVLRRRIASQLRAEEEKLAQEKLVLQSRVADLAAADTREQEIYEESGGALPVVCLDAMLPRQQLRVETDDDTFCRLLRDVGLGGVFVVTSLHFGQKRLRRSGVLVRVSLVDAPRESDSTPTSVRAIAPHRASPLSLTRAARRGQVSALLVGRRRVRLRGPPTGLQLRVGRWRREYDDSIVSERALGWGVERFVDRGAPSAAAAAAMPAAAAEASHHTEWSLTPFEVLADADEAPLYEPGGVCDAAWPAEGDSPPPASLVEAAARLSADLEAWRRLAAERSTYDDPAVTAGARARRGDLRLDPALLLARVCRDLGPKPPPEAPTALALWGGALINPLPSLGVSTEVRGAVLEAQGAAERVALVQRAVSRSIANLEGRRPLF